MNLDQSKLTEKGRIFLNHARTLNGDKLTLIDNKSFDDLSNPIVRVRSKLSWSERTRKYGIESISSPSDWSGKWAIKKMSNGLEQRYMIPTDDYINRVEKCYEGFLDNEVRNIEITCYPYLSVEEAINKAGNDLHELINNGDFEIKASVEGAQQ